MNPLDASHLLASRARPDGRPAMCQEWRDLLFIHWTLEPEVVQRLLPPGLTVDGFPDASGELKAWVALVPFTMHGIRPIHAPALPWISAFPETNVRTYVHREGRDPGVWFFSLDAARWLACAYARLAYALPYHHAFMSLRRTGERRDYRSRRTNGGAQLEVEYEIGEPMPKPEPGSLEFFLVERYRLYAYRQGRLFDGMVAHEPYSIRQASLGRLQETYMKAAGLPVGDVAHLAYSPGVKVEVWPIREVGNIAR